MNKLLHNLNNRIVINDLVVRKMKYEINMLFYDAPSKEKATILAKKIHTQLDQSLIGINEADKESIRKLLILNSFLVLPNPASDHINYGHVFTTLTNYDEESNSTKDRLVQWLDSNTKYTYEEESLTQYIKEYKITSSGKTIKTGASTYQPTYEKSSLSTTSKPPQAPIEDALYKYKLTPRAIVAPFLVLIAIIFYGIFHDGLIEPSRYEMNGIEPTLYDDSLELLVPEYLKSVHKVNIRIIPKEYQYKAFDLKVIYKYLESKGSKLIEKDYLTIIDQLAEKYYINPLLLIAIIGQEQGFVPSDHEQADVIINNPYNVFGSWQEYNTNFEEATIICLNTITTALKNRPENIDLVKFLNKKYSEDDSWYEGVTIIYTTLKDLK
jgi:hypothetical protein